MADHPEPDDKPTGDYIAGHIGENARNVAVGKNIIQIGSLQIPYYLAVIIALCLLIGLGFVAYPSVKPWLPKPLAFAPAAQNETLIVIATFQVTEGNHNTLAQREIRDKIRSKIQELHETNLRAEVEPTVLNADQRTEAEALGKRYGASMVIWGDDTGARVTVNFLNLRQPDFDAARVTISETARTQLANPNAYAQFITNDLPREMSFFTLFAIGQAYYVNTQYAFAIQSIEAAIAQLPPAAKPTGLADAYFRLGWLYQIVRGQLAQAIAAYDQVLKLKPDLAEVYNNRGIVRYEQAQYVKAIADYSQALKLKPDLAETYNNRGIVHSVQGKYIEAIIDYNQALKFKPNDTVIYYNRGTVQAVQGEYAEAIADYDQALKFKPDYAKAFAERGLSYHHLGKLKEALADFQHYLKLEPNGDILIWATVQAGIDEIETELAKQK